MVCFLVAFFFARWVSGCGGCVVGLVGSLFSVLGFVWRVVGLWVF